MFGKQRSYIYEYMNFISHNNKKSRFLLKNNFKKIHKFHDISQNSKYKARCVLIMEECDFYCFNFQSTRNYFYTLVIRFRECITFKFRNLKKITDDINVFSQDDEQYFKHFSNRNYIQDF